MYCGSRSLGRTRSFDHSAYLLVLLLDLLHVTLFTETGNGDKPDGYVEAMAICASKPQCVNFSVKKNNVDMTHDIGIILRYRLGKVTPARLT
jgi:hypothetical protein